jgi:hypothetical protein
MVVYAVEVRQLSAPCWSVIAELKDEVIIGRSDFQQQPPTISRQHLRLHVEATGDVRLECLGINPVRVENPDGSLSTVNKTQTALLLPGARVFMGVQAQDYMMRVSLVQDDIDEETSKRQKVEPPSAARTDGPWAPPADPMDATSLLAPAMCHARSSPKDVSVTPEPVPALLALPPPPPLLDDSRTIAAPPEAQADGEHGEREDVDTRESADLDVELPYTHFDGRAIYLNRLMRPTERGSAAVVTACGVAAAAENRFDAELEMAVGGAAASAASEAFARAECMPEVSRGELLWRREALVSALFTSYGPRLPVLEPTMDPALHARVHHGACASAPQVPTTSSCPSSYVAHPQRAGHVA